MTVAPILMAEIAPINLRGMLVTGTIGIFGLGSIAACIAMIISFREVNTKYYKEHDIPYFTLFNKDWYVLLGSLVIQVALYWWLPESPRWLMARNMKPEVQRILKVYYKPDYTDSAVEQLSEEMKMYNGKAVINFWARIK